ncbi:gluconokinase [Rhizobacter sp. J219]|uniref:gluconokinase n=1 Tax=Rhizobacter sp. J219 TaxID=2898430 RepID=UPI002150F185|nr:gluconokinase [Rhizobacter sp. J219]MCR5881710.1 gluconokinase [Rhizobacter sp. J219]
MSFVVFMGVAGCGKSSAGQAVAQRMGWTLIEGDDYHLDTSKAKMRQGIALDDTDRAEWLAILGTLLADQQRRGQSAALTCSALKRSYRDLLRSRNAGLRFVYLEIDKPHALARVAARAGEHLFPPSLVDSQFATLEPPLGEPGVLCIDALLPRDLLADRVADWLRSTP